MTDIRAQSFERSERHPSTGLGRRWLVETADGSQIEWDGFCTGPVALTTTEIADLCQRLLGVSIADIPALSANLLGSPSTDGVRAPRVFLHSTTPDLNSLAGDLSAVRHGRRSLDFTTYKETRAPYLARPGDLAVGRTRPWRENCRVLDVSALALPDVEHYYMSHALLSLAGRHLDAPVAEMTALIQRFADAPDTVASVYALETELQIFLLWVRAQAGIDVLRTDANPTSVAQAWNRKDVLHPSVAAAEALAPPTDADGPAWLAVESAASPLHRRLGHAAPLFPGYTVERRDREQADFVQQVLRAAQLLRTRHGLSLGCLKPSESGDGARIALGIDLADQQRLTALAEEAWSHGDPYLLEAHVDYVRSELRVDGDGAEAITERLLATPSAHVRAGRLAPGLTLQFMAGSSWKGNIYIDERNASTLGLAPEHYAQARRAIEELDAGFRAAGEGLTTAGVDLGIGRLGGPAWGERVLIGVQDLNVSFTGAECLRAYMDRFAAGDELPCAASRVVRPHPGTDLDQLTRALRERAPADANAQVVAAVPDRWGMIAMSGATPDEAARRVMACQQALIADGVLLPL